jgi:serine/threonine-protein kinase HipA
MARTAAQEAPTEAYVWAWLPGATDPVVAGRLELVEEVLFFNYGRSYLARPDRLPLYLPELPLQPDRIRPPAGLSVASCIRDAAPDAWGQRVILARRVGHLDRSSDTGRLGLLSYLLESGSDRIGALDFQASPTEYVPRRGGGTLEEMQAAADLLLAGEELSEAVQAALLRGTSIGGARPKVLLDDNGRKRIAKLSAASDHYPVVKAEAVAMQLAGRVGLDVPTTEVVSCLGRDVLLVDRFDRTAVPEERRMLVSGLTLLGLDEMFARYATYPDLADLVRARFARPAATVRELFSRIVFNVCIGNTDDHARNHAAFWDGAQLTLTPAYDLCPQPRSGGEAGQAMAIGRDGSWASRLQVCRDAAAVYQLDQHEAQEIIDAQVTVIREEWDAAADAAWLSALERQQLWGRQILNPFIFEPL